MFEAQRFFGRVVHLNVSEGGQAVVVLGARGQGASARYSFWTFRGDGTGVRRLTQDVPDAVGPIGITPSGSHALINLTASGRWMWRLIPIRGGLQQNLRRLVDPLLLDDGSILARSGVRFVRVLSTGVVQQIRGVPQPTPVVHGWVPSSTENHFSRALLYCDQVADGTPIRYGIVSARGVLGLRRLTVPRGHRLHSCRVSDNSQTIALSTIARTGPHALTTFSRTRGTRRFTLARGGPEPFQLSPDGRYLNAISISGVECGRRGRQPGQILLLDAYTGRTRAASVANARSSFCSYPVWSPDGKTLAVVERTNARQETVTLIDSASGRVRRLPRPNRGVPQPWHPVRFTLDSRRLIMLAGVDINGQQAAWYSARRDGSGLLRITGAEGGFQPDFQGDGGNVPYQRGLWFSRTGAWLTDLNGQVYVTATAGFGATPLGGG